MSTRKDVYTSFWELMNRYIFIYSQILLTILIPNPSPSILPLVFHSSKIFFNSIFSIPIPLSYTSIPSNGVIFSNLSFLFLTSCLWWAGISFNPQTTLNYSLTSLLYACLMELESKLMRTRYIWFSWMLILSGKALETCTIYSTDYTLMSLLTPTVNRSTN